MGGVFSKPKAPDNSAVLAQIEADKKKAEKEAADLKAAQAREREATLRRLRGGSALMGNGFVGFDDSKSDTLGSS